MFIYSTTAAIIQLIKVAFFFMTLGLPAAHADAAYEIANSAPVSALHDQDRPHSNPRRERR